MRWYKLFDMINNDIEYHIGRDVGSIQKVGGGACIPGHPHVQRRALCTLKRGTLHTQFVKKRGGHVPPVPPGSYVHAYRY